MKSIRNIVQFCESVYSRKFIYFLIESLFIMMLFLIPDILPYLINL